MKRKTINKLLAIAVSAALCVPILLTDAAGASGAVAFASGSTPSGQTPGSSDENQGGGSGSDAGSSEESSSSSAVVTSAAGATVTIGGTRVTSSIGGIFTATSVTGAAVTTPVANLAAAIGLSSAELQAGTNIRSYICNNQSQASRAALQSAAASVGKAVAGYVNFDLYTITKRGVVTKINTATEPVTIILGLPGGLAKAGRTYSVLAIDPTGKPVVMDNVGTDPWSVTINTKLFGAYSIVY